MRRDIEIDTSSGDIQIMKTPSAYTPDLIWVDEDDDFIYGECKMTDTRITLNNLSKGIGLNVTQKDSLKKIKISFISVDARGSETSTGFLLIKDVKGKELRGSDLIIISDNLLFKVYISEDGGNFLLTNGYSSDLSVEISIEQNEELLLIADVSSILNYPLNGIGIRGYLNANILTSDVSTKIVEEFNLDGMIVEDIKYDLDTHEIVTYSKER